MRLYYHVIPSPNIFSDFDIFTCLRIKNPRKPSQFKINSLTFHPKTTNYSIPPQLNKMLSFPSFSKKLPAA